MRFGRHLREVLVPGKEDACVRYDDLKSAIKVQLAARWGRDAGGVDASDVVLGTSEISRLEEGLLASTSEDSTRKTHAFYDLLSFEIARVAKQYDEDTKLVGSKVRALLREAKRNDVLDALQTNLDSDENEDTAAHAWLTSSMMTGSMTGSWHALVDSVSVDNSTVSPKQSAHQKTLIDHAFKHVYRESLLAKHNASLNFTGLRKIVKKFLKKVSKVVAEGSESRTVIEAEASNDLVELLSVMRSATEGLTLVEGEKANDMDMQTLSSVAKTSSLNSTNCDGSFKDLAERTEHEVGAILKTLRFCAGAELKQLSETLETAYATALDLESESNNALDKNDTPDAVKNHEACIKRIAKRRLRFVERPVPAVTARVTSFSFGVIFCAVIALTIIWWKPNGKDSKRFIAQFVTCVPAFRLTCIPIAWLWCWSAVTHTCQRHYINYRFIMDIALKEEAGWHWNLSLAAVLTAACCCCFALFSAKIKFGVDVFSSSIPPGYYPLCLAVFTAITLTVPPSSIFVGLRDTGRKVNTSSRDAPRTLSSSVQKTGRMVFHFFGKIVNPYARASLVKSVARSLLAPFSGHVRFRDNLVADVACSLVRCLVDFQLTTWLFVTGGYSENKPSAQKGLMGITSPVITCLPYWWRLQQCVRRFYDAKRGSTERKEHSLNGGKYLVSLVAICLASAGRYTSIAADNNSETSTARNGRIAWLFFLCLGTWYSYLWDVIMDWGLLEIKRSSRGFPYLKWTATRDRVFTTRKFYAWAIFSNFIGRVAWAVTVTPHGVGLNAFKSFFGDINSTAINQLSTETIGTFVAIVELLRRAQWTFLRIENEYLNNAARYRSVVSTPMLLDDVRSESGWDDEWKFSREDTTRNRNTLEVYLVVLVNGLVAFGVAAVVYQVYE